MALKGRAKRNYNRTKRYGNWRQIYCDNDGMCQGTREDGQPCGAVDLLEIHEETDGISVIEWKLLCVSCHINLPGHRGNVTSRHYPSKLAEDVNQEILEYGGLENWKKAFHIREKPK